MNQSVIIKICSVHGPLCISDVVMDMGRLNRCRLCKLANNKNTYERHKKERLEKAAAYRQANRTRLKEWAREDRAKNKDKYAEQAIKEQLSNPGSILDVLRTHGLTFAQYEQMVISQNNKCAICRQEETRKSTGKSKKGVCRLCIDHCHETGKVRGLLCHICNTALGKFKDDIKLLRSAISYLELHAS